MQHIKYDRQRCKEKIRYLKIKLEDKRKDKIFKDKIRR